MRMRLTLLVLVCLHGFRVHAGTPAWPEIETPDSTRMQWVAPHTFINGVPQRILEVTTRLSDQALLDWFTRSWLTSKTKAKPVLTRVADKTVIGLLRPPFLFTLQLDAGRLQRSGFLSIANLDPEVRSSTPQGPEFLLPSSARLEFVQEDEHGDKSFRTLHFSSPASSAWLRRHLPEAARQRDWEATFLRDVQSDGTVRDGNCLIVTRNNVRRFIVVSASADGKGSEVIIVEETLH